MLRVHKAIPVKTKNKKTVYVIDRSNVASEAVVMAPSGRASPPMSTLHTLPVRKAMSTSGDVTARSYVTVPHHSGNGGMVNHSFDLVDHTNAHLFDTSSDARGHVATARVRAHSTRSAPHSPRSLDLADPDDLHLRWSEDMRHQLEEKDSVRRHGSEASSMASLPRRKQRAPGEHLYHYDLGAQRLTVRLIFIKKMFLIVFSILIFFLQQM